MFEKQPSVADIVCRIRDLAERGGGESEKHRRERGVLFC